MNYRESNIFYGYCTTGLMHWKHIHIPTYGLLDAIYIKTNEIYDEGGITNEWTWCEWGNK